MVIEDPVYPVTLKKFRDLSETTKHEEDLEAPMDKHSRLVVGVLAEENFHIASTHQRRKTYGAHKPCTRNHTIALAANYLVEYIEVPKTKGIEQFKCQGSEVTTERYIEIPKIEVTEISKNQEEEERPNKIMINSTRHSPSCLAIVAVEEKAELASTLNPHSQLRLSHSAPMVQAFCLPSGNSPTLQATRLLSGDTSMVQAAYLPSGTVPIVQVTSEPSVDEDVRNVSYSNEAFEGDDNSCVIDR